MDTRETTELGKMLEGILGDISNKNRIAIAMQNYLYKQEDQTITIPKMLWYIIECLNEEMKKGNQLNYQKSIVDPNDECPFRGKDRSCWSEEKLVFVEHNNMHINITDRPEKKINCGGKSSVPEVPLCAFFLRGCLYKYNPKCECFVPKDFYRWCMFVFFLYSFDSFCVCFQYCIQSGNKSLNTVFRDILELILCLRDWNEIKFDDQSNSQFDNKCGNQSDSKPNRKFIKAVQREEAEELREGMSFIKWIFRDCVSIGDIRYAELESKMSDFLRSMTARDQRKELIALIKNNERKTDEILGEELRKKLLRELEWDWIGD